MLQTTLKLMTWNIYLGGDVGGVINAEPHLVPSRMAALWSMVQRTDFRSRARVIADRIRSFQPDVIGLQEVYRWSTIERHGLGMPEERLVYDFLDILLEELHGCGQEYFTAVRSFGVDLTLPTEDGPDVRLQDSIAILLRCGDDSGLIWENQRQGRFRANLQVKIDGEPFTILRGWASVDLRQGDGVVRIVNTHLEFYDANVQPAQVQEILDGPASVAGPLVLMGDFNCTPESPTWRRLTTMGYKDAWIAAGSGPGLTSSQDEDLRNTEPEYYERIDWILCRGDIRVSSAELSGHESRTPEGLWPSDHAAVTAHVSITMDASRPRRAARQQNPTEPLAVMREIMSRFERKDFAGVMEFVDPDGEWVFPGDPKILPWAGTFRGAGLMRFFIMLGTVLESEEYKAEKFYPSGEYVTVLSHERCCVKATHKIYDHQLAAVVRVVNGKIVQYLEYSDTAAMHSAFEGAPAVVRPGIEAAARSVS